MTFRTRRFHRNVFIQGSPAHPLYVFREEAVVVPKRHPANGQTEASA